VDNVIFSYTRKQAIADGVLVIVDNKLAKEAGFKYPVAVTDTVYNSCLKPKEKDDDWFTWDMLWMLHVAISTSDSTEDTDTIIFQVIFNNKLTSLKAVFGPDDDSNPCITIMMLNED
jgi:hypothetical protein